MKTIYNPIAIGQEYLHALKIPTDSYKNSPSQKKTYSTHHACPRYISILLCIFIYLLLEIGHCRWDKTTSTLQVVLTLFSSYQHMLRNFSILFQGYK